MLHIVLRKPSIGGWVIASYMKIKSGWAGVEDSFTFLVTFSKMHWLYMPYLAKDTFLLCHQKIILEPKGVWFPEKITGGFFLWRYRWRDWKFFQSSFINYFSWMRCMYQFKSYFCENSILKRRQENGRDPSCTFHFRPKNIPHSLHKNGSVFSWTADLWFLRHVFIWKWWTAQFTLEGSIILI